MFVVRRDPDAELGVGVAFTSAALDLGDRQPAVDRARAYRSLADALGVGVAVAAQVHGRDVLEVGPGEPLGGLVDLTAHRADALVTETPGLAVAVRVADCVPICLATGDGRAVAAVHAGREGLLAGVIDAAVDALRARSDAPVRAWIGPHICAACYEVPPAMARDAAARLGTAIPTTRWGTTGIDLGGAAARQLRARGATVSRVGSCTLEDAALHSHRRDADRAGRMVGAVWLGPASR